MKLFALLLVVACVSRCTAPERFTTVKLYTDKHFSGRDLNNQAITLMPVLTPQGAWLDNRFQPADIIAEVRKIRTDIEWRKPDRFLAGYCEKYGEDALDSLHKAFYSGEIVALQTNERIWPDVGSGYLMVVKLLHGMKATSLDNRTLRQAKLEGELWDCDSSAVVWRSVIHVRSRLGNQTDRDVLLKAAVKLFETLPGTLKGYGKGTW